MKTSHLFPHLRELATETQTDSSAFEVKTVTPWTMRTRRPLVWRVERLAPTPTARTEKHVVVGESEDEIDSSTILPLAA